MVLWPGTQTPATIEELAKCLQGAEERLREWRSSAARAGADTALTFVMSWYEEIELGTMKTIRLHSPWTDDATFVAQRKKAAHFMAGWANTATLIPACASSDDEEIGRAHV